MGDYNETDCVTRLPILANDPVIAIFTRLLIDRMGQINNPFTLFGPFKIDPFDYIIETFYGRYNGYGWIHDLENILDGFNEVAHEYVMLRKSTLEFIKQDMKGFSNWYYKHLQEVETEDAKNFAQSDLHKKYIKKELLEYAVEVGISAFKWAVCGYVKNEEIDIININHHETLNKVTYPFFQELLAGRHNDLEIKDLQYFADQYNNIIRPLQWYCCRNRISIAGASINRGSQAQEFESAIRLARFTISEAQKVLDKTAI